MSLQHRQSLGRAPASKIGFVGFGEVARVFSKAMREHGAEIVACDVLSGPGLVPLGEVAGQAECVLSTVTTDAAVEAAGQCAAHLASGQIYVDLNSTSPRVKLEIGKIIRAAGADFVEGAILGAVGVTGAATPILTGGRRGQEVAELLTRLGLSASFYSAELGKASQFKMLRGIFSKGLEALILELLVAGRRAGLEGDLWRDVCDFMTRNPFDRIAANWVTTHAVAHRRRCHEMQQVCRTMRELGLDPLMTTATEAFFQRSGALGLERDFSEKPDSMGAVVDCLERRLC